MGAGSKIHQGIGDDDLFTLRPTSACNEARSVFADVRKNRRLVDRRLVGCLEIRHSIGGHAWLGSSGLHRFHPLGMVGSIRGPGVINARLPDGVNSGAAADSRPPFEAATPSFRLCSYNSASACFISSCQVTGLAGTECATPMLIANLYGLS